MLRSTTGMAFPSSGRTFATTFYAAHLRGVATMTSRALPRGRKGTARASICGKRAVICEPRLLAWGASLPRLHALWTLHRAAMCIRASSAGDLNPVERGVCQTLRESGPAISAPRRVSPRCTVVDRRILPTVLTSPCGLCAARRRSSVTMSRRWCRLRSLAPRARSAVGYGGADMHSRTLTQRSGSLKSCVPGRAAGRELLGAAALGRRRPRV